MTPAERAVLIAQEIGAHGFCELPNYLNANCSDDIRNDLDQIRAQGKFKPAAVGRAQERQIVKDIRNDETYWLDRNCTNSVQEELWRNLEALQQALNRTLFIGLRDFEGHYAVYPEGGGYQRHLDCFRDNSDRMVTVVIYLNRNWQISDGGQLRVYRELEGVSTSYDIDPEWGKLVCFLSRELEHEVLPSNSSRFSFTGWFKI